MIRVDSAGLHFSEVSGSTSLFGGELEIDFAGGFTITPQLQVVDMTLATTVDFQTQVGPLENDTLHAEASVQFGPSGVSGTFGGYGTVLGLGFPEPTPPDPLPLSGQIEPGGCVQILTPLLATFALPGGSCGEARNVDVIVTIGPDVTFEEGNPAGNAVEDTVTQSVEVTVDVYANDRTFELKVPWTATNGTANSGSDYQIPSDANARQLNFNISPTEFASFTQSIDFEIVRNNDFEAEDFFYIDLVSNLISANLQESVTYYVVDERAKVTIQNDDLEDLSVLNPPVRTLAYFTFDSTAGPTNLSEIDLVNLAPLTDNFNQGKLEYNDEPDLDFADGLKQHVQLPSGNLTTEFSSAALAVNATEESYFEFTVSPKNGGWLPQGLEFFGWQEDGRMDDWELSWSIGDEPFTTPIFSSADTEAKTATLDVAPGWTRNGIWLGPEPITANSLGFLPTPDGAFLGTNGAITFRLTNTDPNAGDWRIDNLAMRGAFILGGVMNRLGDIPGVQEIENAFEQLNNRIPGSVDVLGAGTPTLQIVTDPNDTGPNPGQVLEISVTGTSLNSTLIEMDSNGTNPPADQIVPIHVSTDSDVLGVDFSGMPDYFGDLNIGGTATIGYIFNGLADGTSIVGESSDTFPGLITSSGPFGENVNLSMDGPINTLQVTGGWASGLLEADNATSISISGGDFGADVMISDGLFNFDVVGGDITSGLFDVGGDLGSLVAERVGGVGGLGGSILTNLNVGGNLGEMLANGGTIDAMVNAGTVGLVSAFIDTASGTGGDVAGEIEATSVDTVLSFGGEISASITTHDAFADDMYVAATAVNGQGGYVTSPNSFHIAGGVAKIIGNQINLRVIAGGEIGAIAAVDDGPDRPASLTGRFTAKRFGRVSTDENGTANFELTATGEAWQLDGQPGFGELRVPAGSQSWLDTQIHLQPSVQAGNITFIGAELDTDLDGVTDAVEDAAPGSGDGNGDGIADRLQGHVASLPSSAGQRLRDAG